MMIIPFFSIIIPVYKVEQYLVQCVQSVLCQTFKNFELILVDDGSPDKCPQLCDDIESHNARVRTIHIKNGGLSLARNVGLMAAKGSYVIFLDSDDFWCNQTALEKIFERLKDEEADILIFGKQKYYQNIVKYSDICIPKCDNSLPYEQKIYKLMEQNIYVACAWDKVVRRQFVIANNIAFINGQMSEDIEYCAKLLLCKPKITIFNELVYVYRQQNPNSITSNVGRKNLEHISTVIEKYTKIATEKNNRNMVLLNYIAVEYILWITASNDVKKENIRDLLNNMKEYWYLTNYALYPYVRIVKKIRWLGFDVIRELLKIYGKIKRR